MLHSFVSRENVSVETLSGASLDAQYVTGLVDGEGTFTQSRSGNNMSLYFAIKLTDADRGVLELVRQFFHGFGTIYEVKPRAATRTKKAAYYRISRPDELIVVLAHFDKHPLRTKKRETYEIWRLMVLAKRKYLHPDRELLNQLADALSNSCVRNQPWHRPET